MATKQSKLETERIRLLAELADLDRQIAQAAVTDLQAQAHAHLDQARTLLAEAIAADSVARQEAADRERTQRAAKAATLRAQLDEAETLWDATIRGALQALRLTGHTLTPNEEAIIEGADVNAADAIRTTTWMVLDARSEATLSRLRKQMRTLRLELEAT